ncbi:hypothetical protein AKJ44_01100 [candidate division MSBL1 archaeon SCGC-AAA261F17]|uniref:Uncharacterized protein n=1 Tax=candidate division MSBL1 archaeon SCGC-AAA261F17 TaxID=1698274 RepID=A0A133V700_9EURY|nr:hypothetical protein AKJ44_01100 [candidate division MSBL1 archaeon SCGC-AAA261F17]
MVKLDEESVRDLLEEIGGALRKKITLYLLGGGVMVLRGLKEDTVDLDFIAKLNTDREAVVEVLKKLGFRSRLAGARFERQQAGALERVEIDVGRFMNVPLTDGARSRAEPEKYGDLEVKLLSNEDVFLFKSVTGRGKDLSDLSSLKSARPNWDIIRNESTKMERMGVSKVSPRIVAITLQHLDVEESVIKKFKDVSEVERTPNPTSREG